MDTRLRQAAQDGDIDAFYRLVGTDPSILEQIDESSSFVETPLHVAASLGHTEFAMEMMRLKPSFARKPNQDGFTPIHLALQNVTISEQLVLGLVQVEHDLVRVKGREGETPLHYVARKGNLDLLAKFLLVCPDSIKDVTIRSETPLHVALKYDMVEAFQVLLGWLERGSYDNTSGLKKTILNWKDKEGNTVLHIATSKNQLQVLCALLRSRVAVNKKNNEGNTVLHIATSNNLPQVVRALVRRGVAVNEKNLSDLTALDILESQRPPLDNQEIKDMLHPAGALRASDTKPSITLANYLRSSKVSSIESVVKSINRAMLYMPNEKRNTLLVVAVLIATATYQAGLSPPGGVWQDDYNPPPPDLNTTTITPSSCSSPPSSHHVGTSVLPPKLFLLIYLFNSIGFWLSVTTIFLLLPIGVCGRLLNFTLYGLSVCYFRSILAIAGPGFGGYIVIGFILYLTGAVIVWGFTWETCLEKLDTQLGRSVVTCLRRMSWIDVDGLRLGLRC